MFAFDIYSSEYARQLSEALRRSQDDAETQNAISAVRKLEKYENEQITSKIILNHYLNVYLMFMVVLCCSGQVSVKERIQQLNRSKSNNRRESPHRESSGVSNNTARQKSIHMVATAQQAYPQETRDPPNLKSNRSDFKSAYELELEEAMRISLTDTRRIK